MTNSMIPHNHVAIIGSGFGGIAGLGTAIYPGPTARELIHWRE
jgi:hypothetical protein